MNILLYITIAGLAFLLLIIYSPNISLWLQGLQLKLELKKEYYIKKKDLIEKQQNIQSQLEKEKSIAQYYAVTAYCLNKLHQLGENVTGDSSEKDVPIQDKPLKDDNLNNDAK